jgi:hypothetical protein
MALTFSNGAPPVVVAIKVTHRGEKALAGVA